MPRSVMSTEVDPPERTSRSGTRAATASRRALSGLPLLMPMNLVKDPDNLDEIIQSQSEWLQGEYWPGDFGLGCFDEPVTPEPAIYS